MKKWIVAISTVCVAMSAMSEAPEMFRYQGRLVEGTTLVNASLPMSFKLYDAEIGGLLLYEDAASVQVVDGLYSTFIGDDTVSGSLLDALDNPTVYLELTINGETLSPRERIVSSPYALQTLSDPTPAGTIVLSETYPNTQLEAEGYSVYYEDPTQADWDEVDDAPYIGPSGKVFSFGNKLGLLNSDGMEDEENVFLTEDGKSWEMGNCPISYDSMYGKLAVLDDTLYIYTSGMMGGPTGCSTTDLQNWNTWTNRFTTNMYDNTASHIVAFQGALWAFTQDNMSFSNQVMRSTDGMNWTKMSDGDWGDLSMGGNVLVSGSKLYVSAADSSALMTNYVWSSTDGISWHKSASGTPAGMYTPDLVFFDNALWSFFQNSYTMSGEAWQSTNDGDSWTLVTTNLPNYTIMSEYKVISHDGKLWLWGNDSMAMDGALLWSTNAVEGETALTTGRLSESATLVGLPNGRLWLYTGSDGVYGPSLYYAGGPKKDDGLHYYIKD